MDTTIQETGEQIIYNFVPEAYQEQAFWMLGILVAIIGIYYLTKPIMDSIKAKRQELATRESALTSEEVTKATQDAVNEALAIRDKISLEKQLKEWQYKLMHAGSEEKKQFCLDEIAEIKAKLATYA